MQTIYLRDADLEKVRAAEGELKGSRVVPGRIGLSLLLRIGLDMLSEALETDRDAVLVRAAKVARGEVVDEGAEAEPTEQRVKRTIVRVNADGTVAEEEQPEPNRVKYTIVREAAKDHKP